MVSPTSSTPPVTSHFLQPASDKPLTPETTIDEVVVGNPAMLDEAIDLIAKHGDSQKPLPVTTKWDAVKMPVRTDLYRGFNFNNDPHPDFILVRSFTIFVAPGEPTTTISFLARILGNAETDKAKKLSDDMIKGAKLLWWGENPGKEIPVRGLFASESVYTAGGHNVEFIAPHQNDEMIGLVKLWPDDSPEKIDNQSRWEQYEHDSSLLKHIDKVQAYALNSRGYLSILMGLRASLSEGSVAQYEKLSPLMANNLGFAVEELGRRYNLVSKDEVLTRYYNNTDSNYLPFAKAAAKWGEKSLILTSEESTRIAEMQARAASIRAKVTEAFRWKGKTMTRAEFHMTLRRAEDPEEREKLLTAYTGEILKAMKQNSSLFTMIDKLNKIAQNHGYKSYADFVMKVHHGSTVEAFNRLYEDFHQKNKDKLKAFVGELQEVNGGKPVYEWDVDHLTDKLVSKELGGKQVPEIGYKDAIQVAKNYYRDMGFDLDAPPLKGNIIFDTLKREDKYGNAFAEVIGAGEKTWSNTNFDPNQTMPLGNLSAFIHEWMHNIHIITAAKNAHGNVMNAMEGQPGMWTEGIASTMEDTVKSREWMDRYLSGLPDFSDLKLREAIARSNEGATLYQHMMVLSRARWELNLYEAVDAGGKPRSIEERLHYWPTLARNYMHVEAISAEKGALVYSVPHFFNMPVYYVSYEGGIPLAQKAAGMLLGGVKENNTDKMKRGADVIREVFLKGSRLLTLDDIEKELDALLRPPPAPKKAAPKKPPQKSTGGCGCNIGARPF